MYKGCRRRKSRAKARPLQNHGRRLEVRAERQETAIAVLHHELAAVPGHVAKSASELHALGGVLGIKCVGIFNEEVRLVCSGFVSTNPETRSNSSAYLSGLAVG